MLEVSDGVAASHYNTESKFQLMDPKNKCTMHKSAVPV